MNMESHDKQKKLGISRFFKSFTYSWAGLKYAYRYEQSMLVHGIAAILVVLAGIFFHLSTVEWIVIFLVMGLVMATELINTAIEAVVDLTCPEIHPLAKIAKDTASAAVFVFAFCAFMVGLFIFIPKIIAIF